VTRATLLFGALAALAGCHGSPPATPGDGGGADVFVAQADDFAEFRSWRSVALGAQPNSADPPGPRVAFVSDAPDAAAHRYPLGTRIVKAIENAPDPSGWDLFAMAKRGGDFDPSGTHGWEFFLLRLDAGGGIAILSRGTVLDNPSDAGAAYGSAGAIFCSGCHGAPGTDATDHVLSAALAP
jgi:hypothetical protein